MDSDDIPTPRENLINVSKARPKLARIKEEESLTGQRRGAVNNDLNNSFILKLAGQHPITGETGIDTYDYTFDVLAPTLAQIRKYNIKTKNPNTGNQVMPVIDEEEFLKTKKLNIGQVNNMEIYAPAVDPKSLVNNSLDTGEKRMLLDAYLDIKKFDDPDNYANDPFVQKIQKSFKEMQLIDEDNIKLAKEEKDIMKKYDLGYSVSDAQKNVQALAGSGTNAPMYDSRNKQVDFAIRKSLLDAANDEYVDFVAFPDDVGAIGSVGGTSDPAQGTIDYYQQNVQNRLKSVLRKIDKDLKIEDIDISQQDFEGEFMDGGDFNAKGVRMTPELRKKLIEKGLPSFGVVGGVGLMDFMIQNNKDGRNDSLLAY